MPIITILVIAAAFRLWGITHDLPYSYYPDEEHFVNRAVSFGSGDLNPHWFHKPAFLMYLLFFEYGIYYLFGYLFGLFDSVDAFAIHFLQDKTVFLLLGRLTVAFFGIATVYVTYLIGRNIFNKRIGLISAVLMSFVFSHAASSQVIKADVPSAFFTALSFLFVYKVYQNGQTRDYMLSGIFAGIGMATKYYTAALIPTIFLGHILYLKDNNISIIRNLFNTKIMLSLLAFCLIFFIASPFNVIDPMGLEQTLKPASFVFKRFITDFSGEVSKDKKVEVTHSKRPYKGYARLPGSLYKNLGILVSAKGMGIIGLFSLLGFAYSFFSFSSKRLLLIIFPLSFILFINYYMPFIFKPRYFNPIYSFLTILAAYFIYNLSERFINRTGQQNNLMVVFCGLILLLPAYNIGKHNRLILQKDTRTIAKEWIETNIPSGAKILLEEEAVRLSPGRRYYEEVLSLTDGGEGGQFTAHADMLYGYSLEALPDITYDITFIRFPWWQRKEMREGVYFLTSDRDKDMGNPLKPVGVMDYEFYRENGYEYVIVSSKKYGVFFKENSKKAKRFPSFYRFYNTLFDEGRLIKEFSPDPGISRGPLVKIFKIT